MKTPIQSLRFENLSFSHEGSDPLFRNLDFEFPMNKIIWLKATDGSGKSTLMQLMAGLTGPQTGAVIINDQNTTEMSFEDLLPLRLNIGYSFDFGGLIHNRTILENLLLPIQYHKFLSDYEAKKRVNDAMNRFHIAEFANERPAHVPGRVRKIVTIIRSMILHPELLLLDDPSVGLGPDLQSALVEMIAELREAGTLKHLFISSYDDKFMSSFDYEIIHVEEGLLYHQVPTDLKKAANL